MSCAGLGKSGVETPELLYTRRMRSRNLTACAFASRRDRSNALVGDPLASTVAEIQRFENLKNIRKLKKLLKKLCFCLLQ